MTNEKKLTWFQLMWKNFYIQLFVVAVVALTLEIYYMDSFYSLGGFLIGVAIPISMILMISILGFYKFWKEYNNVK